MPSTSNPSSKNNNKLIDKNKNLSCEKYALIERHNLSRLRVPPLSLSESITF